MFFNTLAGSVLCETLAVLTGGAVIPVAYQRHNMGRICTLNNIITLTIIIALSTL